MTGAVLTRKEARERGERRYFTGKPCKHGHVDFRDVKSKICMSCARVRTAEFNRRNPEKKKAWDTAYAKKNKEVVAEIKRRHYEANKEKIKARVREWEKNNHDRMRENHRAKLRNYRARKQQAGGRHNASDVRAIMKAQRGKCAACRVSVRAAGYHVDHVVPIAKGGTNDKTNLQLLCPSCNLSKSAKDPLHFMQQRGFLL